MSRFTEMVAKFVDENDSLDPEMQAMLTIVRQRRARTDAGLAVQPPAKEPDVKEPDVKPILTQDQVWMGYEAPAPGEPLHANHCYVITLPVNSTGFNGAIEEEYIDGDHYRLLSGYSKYHARDLSYCARNTTINKSQVRDVLTIVNNILTVEELAPSLGMTPDQINATFHLLLDVFVAVDWR